jgi:hypothetical protein
VPSGCRRARAVGAENHAVRLQVARGPRTFDLSFPLCTISDERSVRQLAHAPAVPWSR